MAAVVDPRRRCSASATGYLSSRIGESLIFDLRTKVFAHVQRMSLAFFTRTQTGALVSRLNNDVIGAQRAFTSTLSGTVSNSISVVVVGITMFALSWQVTLACLALFPLLLLASRWVGRQISGLTRRQMDGNADLGNMMTERFNVGGALLLKLFGRRDEEDEKYAEKAGVVRDLGIRISLVTRIFMATMMLIPALATALVYGIGGSLAVNGALTIGTLTALATLLLRQEFLELAGFFAERRELREERREDEGIGECGVYGDALADASAHAHDVVLRHWIGQRCRGVVERAEHGSAAR